MTGAFREDLIALLKARFPILYLETWEEERALAEVARVAEDGNALRTPRPLHVWSRTQGLRHGGQAARDSTDPVKALNLVMAMNEPAVVAFTDLHHELGHGSAPPEATVVRRLRDVAAWSRTCSAPVTVVLIAPVLQIPTELEKVVTVLDFPLPTEADLTGLLEDMVASNAGVTVNATTEEREKIVKAAVGLTLAEAENAFARAMAYDGTLDGSDIELIVEEKRQTIRKSGVLEFVPTGPTFEDVGGLDNLKRWLQKRSNSWLGAAAEYQLPPAKGVLITGVPGCGKSLTAKCTASLWGLPLLRLDIGRVFAGLVGSSEQNMRAALRTAESIAPSILWIDEIEKGFGAGTGSGDSGTSQRVFGTFLTWMQEKKSSVFVVATANKIDQLPPEFLRKGRFDEIFFVDLPTATERRPIWEVHLRSALRGAAAGMKVDAKLLDRLATETEGFSGAEIEQAVVSGLFDAFADRRPLNRDDLLHAVATTVPLSVTQSEQIMQLRAWADVRAVAATSQDARDSYEAPQAVTASPIAKGGKKDAVTGTRGGRVVDF